MTNSRMTNDPAPAKAIGGLDVRIDFGPQPRQHLHWLLNVDLEHSLWSPDRAVWEQHAPGAWEQMEACFTGQTAAVSTLAQRFLIVQTAPRKETRYGQVIVNPGLAQVHFWAKWDQARQDEVPDLRDVIRVSRGESLPFQDAMAQIARVEQGVITLAAGRWPITQPEHL